MTSVSQTAGRDATDMEPRMVALYEAVLDELDLREGDRLLAIGGGAGLFLRLARQRGATAVGDDGTAPLRFPGESFDAVTGLDALQSVPDPAAALREAGRVLRSGASIVLATWGRPDQCEATAYLRAAGALVAPLDGPDPFALAAPGALAAFAARAGLTASARRDVPCVWTFPDEPALLRGLTSTRLALAAADAAGEDAVRHAIRDAVAPFRTSDGGYRLENVFTYIIAHA
jgi:SAM-dependent methyltransferase